MNALQVFKPFGDFWNLSDELNRFVWGLSKVDRDDSETSASWAPAVDITENAEAIKVTAELPGLKREDVKISVSDGVLSISGERRYEEEKRKDNYYHLERRYGTFARSFTLPRTVNPDKIDAKMENGVLEISLPKREEVKPRQIAIK